MIFFLMTEMLEDDLRAIFQKPMSTMLIVIIIIIIIRITIIIIIVSLERTPHS